MMRVDDVAILVHQFDWWRVLKLRFFSLSSCFSSSSYILQTFQFSRILLLLLFLFLHTSSLFIIFPLFIIHVFTFFCSLKVSSLHVSKYIIFSTYEILQIKCVKKNKNHNKNIWNYIINNEKSICINIFFISRCNHDSCILAKRCNDGSCI